ncbi:hypothetical protein DVH24_019332 [Malus domestica]|uniref:Uncharacterized protein n=1 Tax=Malus domestica TaxID=3750 RepID=A0A498I2P2_MALDO|nr:hypothetical protein DVH24_019332 [Malus domestica]
MEDPVANAGSAVLLPQFWDIYFPICDRDPTKEVLELVQEDVLMWRITWQSNFVLTWWSWGANGYGEFCSSFPSTALANRFNPTFLS